jgi:hypothetical protein
MSSRKLETVTPNMAKFWLREYSQDSLDLNKMFNYIEEMQKGRWQPELTRASPIMFHSKTLLNGHHRLMAVVFLDYGVPMYVEVR